MPTIAKVWIEEDCITCDACEDILPEVFSVTDDSSFILAEVREDGNFDRNTVHSPIKSEFRDEYSPLIEEAAEACPVDIIKFEFADGGGEEVAEEASAAELEVTPAEVAPTAVAASGDGILDSLLAGERDLLILFGSQTGNATDLAEKSAKRAADFGLNARVVDMDDFDPSNLAVKRLMIITSTWGEGEMPDNAEGLWQATNSANPALSGTSFSVCAIGDSSYDEFCKAGTDWNEKLIALGANELHPIELCDVDYITPWKNWLEPALARIACIDESGTFQEELVEAMIDYAAGDAEEVEVGDFSAPTIEEAELSLTMTVFRYDPVKAQKGWDTFACVIPGHASVQDALQAVQRNVDGSLSFRTSSVCSEGEVNALSVNGRIVLPDRVRVSEMAGESASLRIEPLPGFEVIKDLVVSYKAFENARESHPSWMDSDPREGEYVENGSAMGVMLPKEALALHQVNDVPSIRMISGMSETVHYDATYIGPGVCLQRWSRSLDPRLSAKARTLLLDSLQGPGGIWSETDIASISRHGQTGNHAAETLDDLRSTLLSRHRFAGRQGKLVKWYSRSVKLSGKVNETTLYRNAYGPIGLASNIINGVSARMALGFTRTGGPMFRSLQALIFPPAGIGKIPNMINTKVHDHHEVVALFNEFDRRF